MKGFVYAMFVGIIIAIIVLISNERDAVDNVFLQLKENNYVFYNKDLQEKYDDWEKDYASDLKEDWPPLKEKIDIYKMKEENDALSESSEFPCDDLIDYRARYKSYYYKEVFENMQADLIKYCNYVKE